MANDEKIRLATEGKLFLHRWMDIFMSKSVFYHEDYYVVRNGIVFFIQTDFTERNSEDKVIDTLAQCECLGDYDKSKIKRENFTYISYKKIRNKFIEKTPK